MISKAQKVYKQMQKKRLDIIMRNFYNNFCRGDGNLFRGRGGMADALDLGSSVQVT